MKNTRLLMVGIFGVIAAFGQSSIPLNSAAPPAATIIAYTYPYSGTSTYYYWLATSYLGGYVLDYTSLQTINVTPSGPQPLTVMYNSVPGSSGYALLRTTTAISPTFPCTCLVGTATTAGNIVDTGGTLSAFNPNLLYPAVASINLDNTNYASPTIVPMINGQPMGFTLYGLTAAMPATCNVTQLYFATDATAGQNLYGCTSLNTWTLEAGGGGAGTVTTSGSPLANQLTMFSAPTVVTTATAASIINTFGSQSANLVVASPNGAPGNLAVRALVAADIPNIAESQVTNLTSDLSGKQTTLTNYSTISALTGYPALIINPMSAVGDLIRGGTAGAPTVLTKPVDGTYCWQFSSGIPSYVNCPAGTGTVTVVGGGSLTSTYFVTGGGTTTIQTPSSAAFMNSSGDASFNSVTTGDGTSAGYDAYYPPSDNVHYFAWEAPATRATALAIILPTTDPTAGQVMVFAAPVAGISVASWAANGSGGGNVSNSGTPLQYQIPLWVDSTHIEGVTCGVGTVLEGSATYPGCTNTAVLGVANSVAGSMAVTGSGSTPGKYYMGGAGVTNYTTIQTNTISANNIITASDETGTMGLLLETQATGSPRQMIRRQANGAIAAHTLVKGVAGGLVGPVASDTEAILGVAENATTLSGDVVWVTEMGITTCTVEGSIVDLHYLIAGTSDPTKCKDSGQTSIGLIPTSTRIFGKAVGADGGGSVAVNVIGPYRFGSQIASADLPSQYKIWTCETGVGDGLNAITAGTYLQSFCKNTTGVSITLTGLQCYIDSGTASTMNAAGNTLGALLTGAVTCSTSFAAGAQSANVTLTNGDYVKFTFVADGTAKQTTWVVTGTY